jgi:hypothetical protein
LATIRIIGYSKTPLSKHLIASALSRTGMELFVPTGIDQDDKIIGKHTVMGLIEQL